jgi:hypothetical protein
MDPVEQRIVLQILFLIGLRKKVFTENSTRCLENTLAHFCKRSDGFAGSRTMIFHGKAKIGQGDPYRIF